MITTLYGDALEQLATLPPESVQCCVTSPPYWGLRSYLPKDHPLKPLEIGQEKTPQEYVDKLVAVFREVRRVLRKDGTLWLNLGDSYAGSGKARGGDGCGPKSQKQVTNRGAYFEQNDGCEFVPDGLKPKDLIGIPWRVAFALQADGWWLRQDIIWCLSGGTWIYVRTDDSGECLMTIKDLYRIRGRGVMLWTGYQWTRLRGMSKNSRKSDEIEIVLRSGERISCTPTHKFPTARGLLDAGQMRVGDILQRCQLPEPYPKKDEILDSDAAWMCGLYLAEGSRSGDAIQIAGHSKEHERWQRIQRVAEKFGGSATRTVKGNKMDIRLYGRIIASIIDEFVTGRISHDKGFSPSVWRRSNSFLESMMLGYLEGDGHWDSTNHRWRLCFCRNYNLERDLRTACARLGWHLILKLSLVKYKGKKFPTFRGEIRQARSGHFNQMDTAQIAEIRKSRCRNVYDLGVCDESHLFSLSSGILTHNSKPNPMPESVTDRCTKAHEYVFLLSKSAQYYYDAEAIKEKMADSSLSRLKQDIQSQAGSNRANGGAKTNGPMKAVGNNGLRNKRSVWTIPTQPFKGAHFATFPVKLVQPCVLAGTSEKGCCPQCRAPWRKIIKKGYRAPSDEKVIAEMIANGVPRQKANLYGNPTRDPALYAANPDQVIGWKPTCRCGGQETLPCTILDPFAGSGTTAQVALTLQRNAILIELNPSYQPLIQARTQPLAESFQP